MVVSKAHWALWLSVTFMKDMAAGCICIAVFPAQQSQVLSRPTPWHFSGKDISPLSGLAVWTVR